VRHKEGFSIMNRSLGKTRRLQQATGPRGTFTVLALDHRGPLKRKLAQEPGIQDVDAMLREVKQDTVRHLGRQATAVLLDPESGWEACVSVGALPGSTGLLVALDTGSTGDPVRLETGLVEGWDPERIARSGASGVKLLVYYHPDAAEAPMVEARVRWVGEACAAAEIPFYLEPLSYDPGSPGRRLPSAERLRVGLAAAERLVPLGVDILKAEFPVNLEETPGEEAWRVACESLTRSCGVPWVLLSAGVSHEVFLRQTAVACAAGASGVIAGRSIWSEAVTGDREGRRAFLGGVAGGRLGEILALCEGLARPVWGVGEGCW
jgi:tagatose-1,6-bisphosphate aldolase